LFLFKLNNNKFNNLGLWSKNQMNGLGVLIDKSNQTVLEGKWVDD
jgi:hypothetical protein